MHNWYKRRRKTGRETAAHTDNNKSNEQENNQEQPLSTNLEFNLKLLKEIMGEAQDLTVREFTLAADNKYQAAVICLKGLAERELVSTQILNNLMLDIRFQKQATRPELFQRIKDYGIASYKLAEYKTIGEVISEIIAGNTVFLLDGVNAALSAASAGWEKRSVSDPLTESVVRGPRDGFTETLVTNTALIRRRIKSPRLRIEGVKLGKHTETDVVMVYLADIARPEIVREVKRRLAKIEIDGVLESGYIEEFIEDNPTSPFPQIEHSERPDKVAAAILEGRVAILVDTTPFALMVPTVFFQFIQASEDYYERYYYGTMVRIIRIFAYFISITLPAFYIALTSFHQEMIPTPLALSIAASREGVPFPAIVEALMMEVTFEILREAGIRLPRPTGQAVGIVGALVIGEAAVQTGIVSQTMLIIVALTGICSFAIPAFNAAIAGRILRFPLMLSAAILGLFGILAGLSLMLIHMCSMRSFGVPYLDPLVSSVAGDFKDISVRSPWWSMLRRPGKISNTDQKRVQPRQRNNHDD